jgi:teichuronic acid biosynthesis glycosyltransferase TuaH
MELKDKTIFFLGTTKFDGREQSTSFSIAKQLSKTNTVYYIDYPFTLKDYFKFKESDQIKFRKSYFSLSSNGVIATDDQNFKIIIIPPLLSINFLPEGLIYRLILCLNEFIIIRRLKKVIKEYNIKDLIYFNSFNFHYPNIADALHPALTVYHCVDPMITPYDIKHGIISEGKLVKQSDLVICTSRQLYNEKKLQNKNTFFIPNAADIAHSGKVLSADLPVDEYVAGLKKPIIGYLGTIERRINYPLLKEVIEKNPDKNFVFAGPLTAEFVPEWFNQIPNLHLLGRIPHEHTPNVIKGFDIAIIPFKKDEVSATIFPLKLFEYLGAGKPVISTNFNPDIEEFTNGTVLFCEDADSFSNAIENILATDNEEKKLARIAIAAENTWDKRASDISSLINSNL